MNQGPVRRQPFPFLPPVHTPAEPDFHAGCEQGGTFVPRPHGRGRACGVCGQPEVLFEVRVRLGDGRLVWVGVRELLEAVAS